MKTKVSFTPGPWHVSERTDHADAALIETTWQPGGYVATIYPRVRDDGAIDSTENAANARLIAASPALLDAVKFMRDLIRENGITPSNADDSWDQWNESLAAIQSAEGN